MMKPTSFGSIIFIVFGFILFCSHSRGSHYIYFILLPEDSLEIPEPCENYLPSQNQEYFDSLMSIFGNHKTIPPKISSQALVALSHYPELLETKIEFKVQKASFAHISRPKYINLFLPKEKWTYIIIVSNELDTPLQGCLHENLDFNSKVGILGHELSHVVYYKQKSRWKLILDAIMYSSEKFKVQFEQETDKCAIKHNLGFQLLNWSQSVHHILEENGRGNHYLSPEEILEAMKSNRYFPMNPMMISEGN